MKLNRNGTVWGWSAALAALLGQAPLASAASPVIINEVLANNASFAEMSGNTPDWVEFYNASDSAVTLVGLYLSTSTTDRQKWAFREGVSIPARGYLVVYCDDKSAAGTLNTGFGLNAGGDSLYLFDASGNVVDSVTFGMQAVDHSIGRVPSAGSTWGLCEPTAGVVNTAATVGSQAKLRINEWMAAPDSGDDWLEIYNPEAAPVALSGLYLTVDLSKPTLWAMPALSYIGTHAQAFERFYASKQTTNGPNHTNFKLDKSGSAIGLYSGTGFVDYLTYGTQTSGVSQGRLPDGGSSYVYFARTSTPAASNYLPLNEVTINEVLSHTDPPLEDSIELYNATDAEIGLAGWQLTDSPADWAKYTFPAGTKIPARGFLVVGPSEFAGTNTATPFSLNSSEGDTLYLSQATAAGALTGYRSVAEFGAAANGISFGRQVNSVGDARYVAQSEVTLGAANSGPVVGPVVISEIMYHPKDTPTGEDNSLDEYVELLNIASSATPLYDVNEPTNTWRLRSAVDFDLPEGLTLPVGGRLLLVNFSPEKNPTQLDAFRAKYNVPTNVPVFGAYSGKLANSDDRVTIQRPDPIQGAGHANEGYVPYIVVDSLHYADSSPWPAAADGTGSALQRLDVRGYADEPTNWVAAAPLPGRPKGSEVGDADADGMPDAWESAHGLNPGDASDAGADADADGMSNLQEYLSGTDPRDAGSRLAIRGVRISGGTVELTFDGVAAKSYLLQARDTMGTGSWSTLQTISNVAATGPVTVTDSSLPSQGTRYYRLTVP